MKFQRFRRKNLWGKFIVAILFSDFDWRNLFANFRWKVIGRASNHHSTCLVEHVEEKFWFMETLLYHTLFGLRVISFRSSVKKTSTGLSKLHFLCPESSLRKKNCFFFDKKYGLHFLRIFDGANFQVFPKTLTRDVKNSFYFSRLILWGRFWKNCGFQFFLLAFEWNVSGHFSQKVQHGRQISSLGSQMIISCWTCFFSKLWFQFFLRTSSEKFSGYKRKLCGKFVKTALYVSEVTLWGELFLLNHIFVIFSVFHQKFCRHLAESFQQGFKFSFSVRP